MKDNDCSDVYNRLNITQLSIIMDNALGNINWLIKHKQKLEDLRHTIWGMKVRINELEEENKNLKKKLKE